MNARPPDMIRSQSMSHINQNMLGMSPQAFPSQPQNGQPPHGQHQGIGIPPNINPNMAFVQGPQPQNNPAYQLQLAQMHQQHPERRRMLPQTMPGHNPQPGHINPLASGQIPGVSFPPIQGGQTGRRVASQPNLVPGANPMNIHPSQQNMGNMAGLGISVPAGTMPGMPAGVPGQPLSHQMRGPVQQQPVSLRQQPPQQQPIPGQMSPGQSIGLTRSGSIPANMIGPSVGRNPGAQPGMLNHQPMQHQQGQPHPSSMQPGLQQHPFPGGGGMGMPPQQQAMGSPSRSSQGHATPSLTMQPQDPNRARRATPENNMFNFTTPQFQMGINPSSRMPGPGANQFSLGASSTPPGSSVDLSQAGMGPGGPSNQFSVTPAQQLAHMQAGNPGGNPHDGFQPPFSGMPPPPHQAGSAPPRPPSSSQHGPRLPPHQPQQSPLQPHHPPPPHMSPHHPQDQMNGHVSRPPRPQSSQPPTPGRPPSQQAGPSRTPHVPHSTLPPDATILQGRPPNVGGPPPPHHGQPQGPMPPGQPPIQHNAPGHGPPLSAGSVPPPNARGPPPPQSAPSPQEGPGVALRPVPPSRMAPTPLGHGQATLRMLQLSGMLSTEVPEKLQLSYWSDLIDSFFVPSAVVKLQLWKDNQNTEAKVFEVGTPILPRFFLVTSQSGVKSMTLTLDGAREFVPAPNVVIVDVVSAVWTYRYQNGYTVTLRGPLSAQMCIVPPPSGASVQALAQPHAQLRITSVNFSSEKHEKYISIDAIHGQLVDPIVKTPRLRQTQTPINGVSTPAKAEDEKWEEPRTVYERASIPAEPVNAFGIPQATMRCLELAESVAMMGELISYAAVNKLGPRDALKSYAQNVREHQGVPPPGAMQPDGAPMPFTNADGSSIPTMHSLYPPPTPTSTSMPGAPGAPPPPGAPTPQTAPPPPAASLPSPAPSTTTKPKNTPKLANAANPAAGSAPAPSSSATSTPAMTATTLKRKAQNSDTASPTTGAADHPPPAKRTNRKRARQSANTG